MTSKIARIGILLLVGLAPACKKTTPGGSVKDDVESSAGAPAASQEKDDCSTCHDNTGTQHFLAGNGLNPLKAESYERLFDEAGSDAVNRANVCGRLAYNMYRIERKEMPPRQYAKRDEFLAERRVPALNALNAVMSARCAFGGGPNDMDENACLSCHTGKDGGQPLLIGGLSPLYSWSWEYVFSTTPAAEACATLRKIKAQIDDDHVGKKGYAKAEVFKDKYGRLYSQILPDVARAHCTPP
jgi:hypothetical protein